MAVLSRSPKLFLERAGIRPTVPEPHPTHDMLGNPAHRLELSSPLPLPEFQADTQGVPPPDRGVTEKWPNGNSET
jgi:hypothetical protein